MEYNEIGFFNVAKLELYRPSLPLNHHTKIELILQYSKILKQTNIIIYVTYRNSTSVFG